MENHKRKENMKAATVSIRRLGAPIKDVHREWKKLKIKKNMGENAYMDPTHRIKGMLILNGKNFLLIYSLTLSCRI